MAVYKNTYGRRRLTLGLRTWCIGIMISSLYLTSSCSCMTTGLHHGRHNHHRDTSSTSRKSPINMPDDPSQVHYTSVSDINIKNDIRAKTLWSRAKAVPTFHKSDVNNLEISRRTPYLRTQQYRPSDYLKTNRANAADYQSDFDSRDYESEDPRPHVGFADEIQLEHQLEKSLLDKEHTSRRPEVKCDDNTKATNAKQKDEIPSGDSPLRRNHHHTLFDREKFNEHLSATAHCPTCYAHYLSHEKTFVGSSDNRNKLDSESIRLEAIKQQILNKLGLKHRPIIRKKLPREIVLQSLYRAEEDNLDFFNDDKNSARTTGKTNDPNEKYEHVSATSNRSNRENSTPASNSASFASTNDVQDDFYARTSEIIVFGDAGNKLNNQQLVEFSLSKYSDTGDQELKIKAATLWVKVSFHPLVTPAKKVLVTHKNVTLWVFRVVQDNLSNRISSQEFDKFMEMATSLTVNLASLGWQKFDLTNTVRDWYQHVLKPQQTSSEPSPNYNYEEVPYATNASNPNYRYVRSKTQYTNRKPPSTEQKDINRLNYESVAFGNYQNGRNESLSNKDGINIDYEYEEQTDDQNVIPISKKLRLLIDCSGCNDLVQIHLFNYDTRKSSKVPQNKNRKSSQHKQKYKDYEIYTYDGYYNDHAESSDNPTKNKTLDNKRRKNLKSKTENVEHRHSNHERNTKPDQSSTYSEINLDDTNENTSTDDPNSDDPNRPFLVIHTDPNTMRRVRRRALDCTGALKGQCCKQPFYVNFTDLGWSDWILAPQGYYANYCMGSCNSVHRTPDTFLNHYTYVIYEYQKYGDLKGLQPCCAPVKFSSTSLIYFGPDSNIIKRDLPKMTVDECGCP